MKKRLVISLLISLFCLAGVGLGVRLIQSYREDKQSVHIAAYTNLGSLDPHQAEDTDSINVLLNTQEGLYRLMNDGTYQPGLAKEEPIVSKDQRVYTFRLKPVNWSNGKPLKAEDFVYSWRRLVDPKTQSPHAYLLDKVIKNAEAIRLGKKPVTSLGVRVNKKKELVVELESPVHYLKALLDQPALYPLQKEAVVKAGKAYGDEARGIPSIGPYCLKNWKKYQASWTYEKNDQYYGAPQVQQKRIQVIAYPSLRAAYKDFKNGRLDILPEVGKKSLDLSSTYHFTLSPEKTVYYLQLNLSNPILKPKEMRKSLALAINKKALADQILQDGSKSVDYLIPSGLGGLDGHSEDYRTAFPASGEYDPDRARRLYQRLGNDNDEKTLRLVMEHTSSSQDIGEFIQTQIKDILPSIDIKLVYLDRHQLMDVLKSGDFDLAFSGWNADFDDPLSFLQVFLTTSSINYGHYEDKGFDQLVEAGRSSLVSIQQRWEYYYQAETRLIEDGVVIPFYQPYNTFIRNERIQQLLINPLGPLYDLRGLRVTAKK